MFGISGALSDPPGTLHPCSPTPTGRVETVERARIDEEANTAKVTALEALTASLPAKVEEPGLP